MISDADITLNLIHRESIAILKPFSDTARLDSELIIMHVLGIARMDFILQPERVLKSADVDAISRLIQKRKSGYPVAYITGVKHFWDLELTVNEATLVPRPETELLVETALLSFPARERVRVLDLGTGSGAIAIALAKHRPDWQVLATDISDAALSVAQQNAARYTLANLQFIQSDWFSGIDRTEHYDLILSNPPYIAEADPHLKLGDVQYEPRQALIAGKDGLDDLQHIISQAALYLKPAGMLLLEHGYDQAAAVRAQLEHHEFSAIQQAMDLAGHIRCSSARHQQR